MTTPRSNTLFHFTKTIDALKGILSNGFEAKYCLEDMKWLGVDFFPIPMVCFCDIPISRISLHTAFYGSYGVGVSKEWALKNSLQPVIYAPNTGSIAKLFNEIIDLGQNKLEEACKIIDLKHHFVSVTTITKPLSGNMLIGGEIIEKEFYQENEWRFVPENFDVCKSNGNEFYEQKDELNKTLAKNPLAFSPQDIKYIFVKSESEVPIIFDFIQQNLGKWPLNEIKILISKIISLETIQEDV